MMSDTEVKWLARLLRQALPLAVKMLTTDVSPELRSSLRDASGDGVVFDLSNCLNALCSESAYKARPSGAIEFYSKPAQQAAEGSKYT